MRYRFLAQKKALAHHVSAAKVLAALISPCLGPMGRSKIVVSSEEIVVSDSASSILKNAELVHPVAKLLAEIASKIKAQVGDGANSVVILVGELLSSAEDLLGMGVHPMIVVRGWRIALNSCLGSAQFSVEKPKLDLLTNVARTYLSSELRGGEGEYLGRLMAQAVIQVSGHDQIDLENIMVEEASGGYLRDSLLVNGIALKHEVGDPNAITTVKNARIAIVKGELQVTKPKKWRYESHLEITDPGSISSVKRARDAQLKEQVEKIVATGANVLLLEKGLSPDAIHRLARRGILVVRRIIIETLERFARATGGKAVSFLDDISQKDLGRADLVEEKTLSDDYWIFVEGCRDAQALTLIVRGETGSIGLSRLRKMVQDGLKVVSSVYWRPKTVVGGGAFEAGLARKLRKVALKLSTREQLVVDSFSQALESIPKILAKNSGMNPLDTIAEVRRRHALGENWMGVDSLRGRVSNMRDLGVLEPLEVKELVLKTAVEVASSLIRIDNYIMAKPAKNKDEKLEEEKKKYLEPERVKKIHEEYGVE